jgi:alkaline phosphatase D
MLERLLIDRRHFIAGAGAGLVLPHRLLAAPTAGFTHGVASGEPGPTSMLFWTRFVGAGTAPAPLRLELSTDARMTRPRVVAETTADPVRDWTARATATGLTPGRTYYYRWTGPGKNVRSMVGRTRTLPDGAVPGFRLGVFSCSNLPYGWFNGYGHAAGADDIDLFVHLGDYIYEYARGVYPDARSAIPGRLIEPAGPTIRREDYWRRYASYRADPDLQALHARFPAVTTWDDHEIANDAWARGAENHNPRSEGTWDARLAAAKAAYFDWMPVNPTPYAKYDIGRLATLYRLDTRVTGRDEQIDLARAIKAGPDTMTALKRVRDEQWLAGNRQLLGEPQERWLFREMETAQRGGRRWQVLAQQVIMGKLMLPEGADRLAGPNASPEVAAFLGAAATAARLGIPMNLDAWDGYPAARARLLGQAQRVNTDLVVLAGDSHNAWANDLTQDSRPAGVEFAVQSVTSPGFETYLRTAPPAAVAGALMSANPTLRWADTAQRGYLHLTLTPADATAEWRFTAPVATRAPKLTGSQRARVLAGQRRLTIG